MAANKNFDRSHFRWSAVAVLAVLGVGLCYGCCAPKGFYGPVRVLRTTVAPNMPDTSVKIFGNAYDARHKRVAIGYEDVVDNKTVYIRNILDYGKGLEYLVTGGTWYSTQQDSKCSKYPLQASWRQGACIPANSSKSEGFYMGHPTGQYLRQMDAVTFTHTQGSLTAKVMVTQNSCALVGEVLYDTSDPAGTQVINRLYVNQSMYEADDFFKLVNVTCVPDPNPPKMTPWQRMGLFGWLLGRPDN